MLYQVYPTGYFYDKHAAFSEQATNVNSTSFTASWSDATPGDWVTDYTLCVQPYDPTAHEVVLNETFAAIDVNIDATTALSASKVGNYCDNPGWTGNFVYLGAGGCFIVGGQKYVGSLTTPALQAGADGKITLRFNARYFGTDNSVALVTCGDTQLSIPLARMATDYTVVFENVEDGAKVTFGCTGRASRFYLDDVVVTTGDDRDPVDAGFLVIPDITTKDYTVTGLETGMTYRYQLVTRFADGVTRKSNMQLVTLLEQQEHSFTLGDVNHDNDVNVSDVVSLISSVVGDQSNVCEICADINGDGSINVSDVTALINIIMNQ